MKLFRFYNGHRPWHHLGGISLLLAACFLLVLPQPALHAQETPQPVKDAVSIPDESLRTVLEKALGKAVGVPITAAEMKTLTRLNAKQGSIADAQGGLAAAGGGLATTGASSEISDLTGLETAVNLITIDLRNNDVSDLSPLANLPNLEWLYLESNAVSDLSALKNLTTLKGLYLESNAVSDLSVLANLTTLEGLHLYDNQISDISALASLTSLLELDLGDNQISDISALAGLTSLEGLFLYDNQISDISALAGLTNLEDLYLQKNEISDFSPIEGLVGQLTLYEKEPQYLHIPDAALQAGIAKALSKNAGDRITTAEMKTLTRLEITRSPTGESASITDLTGLEVAVNLTVLTLDWNQISNISALASLTNLTDLDLSRNAVSDLSGLSGLTNLEDLDLYDNQVSDLSGLSGLTNLEDLYLNSNAVSDLSGLSNLTNLEALTLNDNQVSDLSGLSKLTNLQLLSLNSNQVSDLSALANLTNLDTLELKSNQVSDISSLSGLTNLTHLHLKGNQISDISALASLTNLQNLDLSENQIADFSPIELFVNGLVTFRKDGQTFPPVDIPDAPLRSAIEKALSKNAGDTINAVEMAKLTSLNAANSGIVDLTGLEKAVNLTALNLHSNQIVDVSPLANLTKLTSLVIHLNHIADFSPITDLLSTLGPASTHLPQAFLEVPDPQLYQLLCDLVDLPGFGCQIDRGAVANLTSLDASNRGIIDLTGLEAAAKLETLNLSGNQIKDVSPLAGLTNLENLDLSGNRITDFSAIAGLVDGLTTYNIAGQVKPFSLPDANLRSAVEAALGKSAGDTITEADMARLQSFGVQNAQISDLTGLEAATNLVWLFLDGNSITDLSPLSGLSNLSLLSLTQNDISDVSPLSEVTSLRYLLLDKNRITDFSPIEDIVGNLLYYSNANQKDGAAGAPQTDGFSKILLPAELLEMLDAELAAELEALFRPERTALLANYPNPFNPETWIPYELANAAEVSVSIYSTQGHLVRQLELGHQDAGIYRSRSRAVYWDGRNAFGERVASGIYFYVLMAGDFAATRKMLILK